jgi:cytochrome c556
MQQYTTPRLAALLTAGLLGTALVLNAADKPKHSVKDVMKALHKGDDALAKKVSKGEGTKDDFKKLVEYYAALPLNDAPKGDASSWKEKTTALLDAAKALEAGKAGALDQYKAAVNCKACHSAHKPD